MSNSKFLLILNLSLVGPIVNKALAPNIYLAEIDNQSNSRFYIATSPLYLSALKPSGPGSIENNINDPKKTYIYEYMILDEEAKSPKNARLIDGKGTYTMDTRVPSLTFSGNVATQPTKNDWQTALEFTDSVGSSPSGFTKTIYLVPLPLPGSPYNDTCDPTIMIGLNSLYDPSISAQAYLIAKTVGTTNCCQIGGSACSTDSLAGPPFTLSTFPQGSPDKPTKLKLTISSNWALKLEVI